MGTKQTLQIPETNAPLNMPNSFLYGTSSLKNIENHYLVSEISKKKLSFQKYEEYEETMNSFINLLYDKISKNNIENKLNLDDKILSSYFMDLNDEIDIDQLFELANFIYKKIGAVFGLSQIYPKKLMHKINFGLIAKYLSLEYNDSNEIFREISEKIIKKMNFLTDEFPFKLFHIINIIESKCCYLYGYDKNFNLNIWIEPYNIDEKLSSKITYLDYIIYITFILDVIIPALEKKNIKFNDKINIFINFNQKEANLELINYLISNMNNYYPLTINKMYIVNYNVILFKKNTAFKEKLKSNNFNKNIIFFPNDYNTTEYLEKIINKNMIPKNFGGEIEIENFNFEKEEDIFEKFAEYLSKNIFCKI